MDLIFDNPSAPLTGRWRGLVAGAFMQTPPGQSRYRLAMARVVRQVFASEPWSRHLDEWANVLRPAIGGPDSVKRWEEAVEDLRRVVHERRVFVSKNLSRL